VKGWRDGFQCGLNGQRSSVWAAVDAQATKYEADRGSGTGRRLPRSITGLRMTTSRKTVGGPETRMGNAPRRVERRTMLQELPRHTLL
jgi:hypothetical protein